MATLSGCSSTFRFFNTQAYLNTDLIEASYEATEKLNCELRRKIPKGTLIVVSTLLNVKKNPNDTSSFGRIISTQIATALQNSGYQIIALDLPIDLFMMEDNGELKLSDEQKALFRKYKAAVLVGGVYAPGKQNAYVSLRAVNRFTKHVIASTDFSVALGPDVKNLLKSKEADAALIPSGSAGSLPEPIPEDNAPAPEPTIEPAAEGEPVKLEPMPGEPEK
ncbi:MAG: FlgO family outer membrane protein [Methylococcales bacterium]|nr:FlgO family outer membrane protein [Methylococcales bacterium]